MFIAVDFDGTIVKQEWPKMGELIPQAAEYLRQFRARGARLFLWTMRCDQHENGDVLTEAVDFCKSHGIEFDGVNTNHDMSVQTKSPKCYADIYIDDRAFGCPLIYPENGKPYVDWDIVGPQILEMLKGYNAT